MVAIAFHIPIVNAMNPFSFTIYTEYSFLTHPPCKNKIQTIILTKIFRCDGRSTSHSEFRVAHQMQEKSQLTLHFNKHRITMLKEPCNSDFEEKEREHQPHTL